MFTKNRDRLLTTEMSHKVMSAILAHREVAPPCRTSISLRGPLVLGRRQAGQRLGLHEELSAEA